MPEQCAWVGPRSLRRCELEVEHAHYPKWPDSRWTRLMLLVWWPQRRPRRPFLDP